MPKRVWCPGFSVSFTVFYLGNYGLLRQSFWYIDLSLRRRVCCRDKRLQRGHCQYVLIVMSYDAEANTRLKPRKLSFNQNQLAWFLQSPAFALADVIAVGINDNYFVEHDTVLTFIHEISHLLQYNAECNFLSI